MVVSGDGAAASRAIGHLAPVLEKPLSMDEIFRRFLTFE